MKKCGIIGGLGPEATVEYYRGIIAGYREKITDGSYPEVIIHSIDMTRMIGYIQSGDRASLVSYISSAVDSLKNAGADFAVLSSNTPHIAFDEIEKAVPLPMISIVKETACEAERKCLKRCGLLGTAFTMKNDQITGPVKTKFGYHVLLMHDKRPARENSFDQVKDLIIEQIKFLRQQEQYEKIAENLRKKYNVQILLPPVNTPPVGPR